MEPQLVLIFILMGCAAVLLWVLIRILRSFSPSQDAQKNLLVADGYEKLGRPQDALRSYRKTLACDPSNSEAVKGMCLLFLRNDDVSSAISVLNEFCKSQTEPAAADFQQTLRLLQQKKIEEAIQRLNATWN